MPDEWTFDEELGGFHFTKQTLLEWSIVPIPANPGCYHLGKAHSAADAAPLIEYAQRTLDALHGDAGVFLTRARVVTAIRRALDEPIVVPEAQPAEPADRAGATGPAVAAEDPGSEQLGLF